MATRAQTIGSRRRSSSSSPLCVPTDKRSRPDLEPLSLLLFPSFFFLSLSPSLSLSKPGCRSHGWPWNLVPAAPRRLASDSPRPGQPCFSPFASTPVEPPRSPPQDLPAVASSLLEEVHQPRPNFASSISGRPGLLLDSQLPRRPRPYLASICLAATGDTSHTAAYVSLASTCEHARTTTSAKSQLASALTCRQPVPAQRLLSTKWAKPMFLFRCDRGDLFHYACFVFVASSTSWTHSSS